MFAQSARASSLSHYGRGGNATQKCFDGYGRWATKGLEGCVIVQMASILDSQQNDDRKGTKGKRDGA